MTKVIVAWAPRRLVARDKMDFIIYIHNVVCTKQVTLDFLHFSSNPAACSNQ